MADKEKLIQAHTSPEHKGHYETGEIAGERLKQLEKNVEANSAEKEPNQREALEHARKQAEMEAVFSQEASHEQKSGGEPEAAEPAPATVSKQQKNTEYRKTMKGMQSQLSKPSRALSKTIHQPAVEKTSEAVGSSVARPNAILAGSFTAFIAVLGVYLLAHYNGFRLSGFETIAAFVVGWVVGMVLDMLRVIFQRRRIS